VQDLYFPFIIALFCEFEAMGFRMNLNELLIKCEFLDQIQQPIFIKNMQGTYVYCNQSFSDFIGIPTKKIISNTAHEIAPQNLANVYTAADRQLFESNRDQRYLSKVKTDKPSEVKVIFKKSVVHSPNNDLAGFIGAVEIQENLLSEPIAATSKLTERETDILNLLAQGKSNKVIAALLQLSPHTVHDHLKSIYQKLDVQSENEEIYKALSFFATRQ
jgi:PAS domain S-box-containing protein